MSSMPLSARLRSLRESHKLTQQDLGTYLNISRQGYAHYESGVRVPDFHVLERIANLYGISLDALLAPCHIGNNSRGKMVNEASALHTVEGLSRQEQTFLKLFSQLTPEDKEDFIDLLSIKAQQSKIRNKSSKLN